MVHSHAEQEHPMVHSHTFDPVSGWCHYCNLRRDNRLISKAGDIYRTGPYAHDDETRIDQIIKAMKEQKA